MTSNRRAGTSGPAVALRVRGRPSSAAAGRSSLAPRRQVDAGAVRAGTGVAMPLRRVLLLLVVVVFGLATAVFTATLLWVVERADRDTRLAQAEAHRVILYAQIDRHYESLELLHRYFTRNDALREALLRGQDPVFALDPLFNQLAGLGAISRLSLQLPDLGRVYDSEPGALRSPALQRTAASGRPERALIWRDRRLEVMVTLPLFERGRVIAVVGLARPFDLAGLERLDGDRRLVLRIREDAPPPRRGDASASDGVDIALEREDGRIWQIDRIALDVEGADDRRLWVEFRQDATDAVRARRGAIVGVLLVLAAVGSVNLAVLIFAGRWVFAALDRAIDGLERAGRGETVTHPATRLRIVETERLARAAERMAESLRQRAMAEAEARMAFEDPVTGLANRRALKRMLRAHADAVRLSAPAAADAVTPARGAMVLMLLDVDHFKMVNDLHGHSFGDRVLRKLADRLKASVDARSQVFHLGSDELVVVLDGFRSRDGLLCDHRGERLETRLQRVLDAVQEAPSRSTAWSWRCR